MFISALPWWVWIICGIVSVFLARMTSDISKNSGSAVARLANWILRIVGIICILIGLAVFLVKG
jgi:uncharacterized protein YjeT (DUF2065 family)